MAFLLSFDGDSPADPRLARPCSAHLGETVAGCCRSVCDMRRRDQPPQHRREIWRLIERMFAEDFRAFSSRVLRASCTFGAASLTSPIRSRTNNKFSGSTEPALMKHRVFFAHRQGF